MIVVGIGEALWDMLPEGKQLGGAPANFAYNITQMGMEGYAISALGKDDLGDEIINQLDAKQMHYIMPRVDYPTGTVLVELDDEGVPCYEIKEDVAWDHIPFTDEMKRLAFRTRAVCFGSLAQRSEVSRATILKFIDTVPSGNGQLKIFDINLRQHFYTKELIEDSLIRCNVLKINDEELIAISRLFAYGGTNLEDRCWKMMQQFKLDMLILTCGINGSYVYKAGEVSYFPTPKVPIGDTVGAGDSFTAAFCSAILKGKTVAEAHKLAVDVSAYVCTQHGAMPPLPDTLTVRFK